MSRLANESPFASTIFVAAWSYRVSIRLIQDYVSSIFIMIGYRRFELYKIIPSDEVIVVFASVG